MPSIAQQDYIVIAPKVADVIDVDAYALGQLAKILEKKDNSIFDVIIQYNGLNRSKIIGVCEEDVNARVSFSLAEDLTTIYGIIIHYTSTQYEGLAAIQENTGQVEGLPNLKKLYSFLAEGGGIYITDTEEHKISVTITDGKLASVAISEETDQDGIKVPFEEIQKLIGLPIEVPEEG